MKLKRVCSGKKVIIKAKTDDYFPPRKKKIIIRRRRIRRLTKFSKKTHHTKRMSVWWDNLVGNKYPGRQKKELKHIVFHVVKMILLLKTKIIITMLIAYFCDVMLSMAWQDSEKQAVRAEHFLSLKTTMENNAEKEIYYSTFLLRFRY